MTKPPHFTVLSTCPGHGSRNVGDLLIERRLKELLEGEIGACSFTTFFREEPLADKLAGINRSRAVLMPAFPIRDTPMHPGTYRLVEDLERISVPLVPVGANWNVYPGDAESRDALSYSGETVRFLRHVAGQVPLLSCREHNVRRVLAKHGVENTVFTGDPAMFDRRFLGRPMWRPADIRRLVFSPPLSPYYAGQAGQVMATLAAMFPDAERWCVFHLLDADGARGRRGENSAALSPGVTAKNRRIRARAGELGYGIRCFAGDLEGLRAYEECDLHVGYECHAHLYFLSVRRPSVLIAEDARGVGFNQALGVGGITGFRRLATGGPAARKTLTSGYCTTAAELALAAPRKDAPRAVREMLEDELATGFRRYCGLAAFLDETYARDMAPFLGRLAG